MLASLFGALVGGLLAVIGGWLGVHWHAEREARGVASALLAELSVAQKMLESAGMATFYQELLDDWKTTGQIHDRQAVVDMFDHEPQDSLPVYYSMASKLGLLPKQLAAEIVQYHANVVALPRAIVRFLGRRELDRPTVQEIAKSIEQQLHENNRLRKKLLAGLADFAAKPVSVLPERAADVPDQGAAG